MVRMVQSDYSVVTAVFVFINYFPVFISLLIIWLWQSTIYFTAFHIYRPIVFTTLYLNRVLLTLFWNGVLTNDKDVILGVSNAGIRKSARNLSSNIYRLWNFKFFLRFSPNINFLSLQRCIQKLVKHLRCNFFCGNYC